MKPTIIEKAHIAIKSLPKLPNIVPKKVAENIKVNLKSISFEVDPIQNYTMQLKIQKLPVFAEAMNRNLTGIYFHFLDYKVEKKEPSILEWKGGVRTGKTTGAISTHKYIGQMSGVEFTIEMICPNEQYFVQRIPYAANNTSMIVDEQMEQHTGLGCLTAGHKIFTDIGWMNIEDLEKQPNRKILSVNMDDFKTEWVKGFKFMKYETNLPLYEIMIEGGGRLIVTPEHKLPVFESENKFKYLRTENLEKGDKLRVIRKVRQISFKRMNPNFAEFLGLLIAEGSLSKIKHKEDGGKYRPIDYYRNHEFYHYAIKFYNKERNLINIFKSLFLKLYPKFKIHEIKRERDIMLICNHKKVFEDVSKHVPIGKKSGIVKVPESIFKTSLESKRRFIKGLYQGDGSYGLKYKDISARKIIYYSLSEKLCREIKLLLLEFGIKSQIRSQHNIGFKPYVIWTATITSDIDISSFMKIFFNKDVSLGFNKSNYSNLNLRKIISIKKLKPKKMEVFDIEVPMNHNFIVEGILSKNSFREMQHTEDLNNIIAKNNISISWIHPPEFVGRNAFYGLETAGRNFEHKLTKFLIYDLTQKTFGVSSIPLGFVIIPKYDDIKFETEYERRKDLHIDALKNESIAVRQQSRLDEGFALAKNKLYQRMKNNHQKIQLARRLFPMRTEGEYMELVSIANMNIKLGINQLDFDNAKTQVDKDLKDLRQANKNEKALS